MKVTNFFIDGLLLFEPILYNDERGFFLESFNKQKFEKIIGYDVNFIQDNHSKSIKNVFRGLHYQINPKAQSKLIRVIKGEIIDFVLDIRPNSKTFGKYISVNISAENKKQLWIPKGFAHGFLSLYDDTEIVYKVDEYYSKECDRCIKYNDPDINLPIPDNVIVSKKDLEGKLLKEINF